MKITKKQPKPKSAKIKAVMTQAEWSEIKYLLYLAKFGDTESTAEYLRNARQDEREFWATLYAEWSNFSEPS